MKILIIKQIHSCFAAVSSKDIWVQKEIELPFAPYVGLYITDGKDFHAQIQEISWDVNKKILTCYTESDKEIYNAELRQQKHRPLEEIVKNYLDYGWEKRGDD